MDREDLIKKWLDNDLSEKEAQAFEALEDTSLYKEIIDEAKRFDGTIHAKVKPFETLENKLENKKSTSFNWQSAAMKIAAVLVVGIAVFALFNKDKVNNYQTKLAQNETITLPDNSIVTLNETSQLEFNASQWDKKRTLTLKGEAFFDVEKGQRFDVNTTFGKVSVLGTEFNVISRDSFFKVSCFEGLVQVDYNNKILQLPAGTQFILKSGQGEKTTIAIAEPYWLKNMSVFKNTPINLVLKDIETQFKVSITKQFNDTNLNFTGAFEHKDLDKALQSVTQPLNLTYAIKSNKAVVITDVQN